VGKVDRISPVVDAQSGTVKVTLRIPSNQGLVPGMYVEVELVVAREDDALRVPKRALVYDDVQSFVYRLEPLPVETEAPDGDDKADDKTTEKTAEKDTEKNTGKNTAPPKPADGIVRRLLIQPILEDRESIVPAETDGLSAGDRLVVAGQAGLKDGAKVRLVEGVAVASETASDEAGEAPADEAVSGEAVSVEDKP
jgi:membrane fusion protein (multidrug efflux system)